MIRVISPEGIIGSIPEENLPAATIEGFRVMTNSDMANLYNRQDLERRFFEKNWMKQHKTRLHVRKARR